MNKIPNRQAICETLLALSGEDHDIFVLTSDSRGSASMGPFAAARPAQFVEVGIAEQNIVGIAAGLAAAGKKPYVASPACFLSMRSIEQIKVDVAYSHTNVKLIGISGGLSYGALGMSHHSLQDIAVMRAIPGIQVLIPADRHEAVAMFRALAESPEPAYIRVGRNPVEDIYESPEAVPFEIGKAVRLKEGRDITLMATGETVRGAMEAAQKLEEEGISARVLNVHTLKPLDEEAVRSAARDTGRILTVEEHSVYGGLGAAVAQITSAYCPVPVMTLAVPDEPAVPGKSQDVFAHYGLDAAGILRAARKLCRKEPG